MHQEPWPAQPGTPIAPAGNSSFTIRFSPSATGVRNATVSIGNDSGENPFDFAISGTGTAATTEFRLIEIKPDLATGNVTLRWVGDGPQFQVEQGHPLAWLRGGGRPESG